jgi:hypothetical protein
LSSARKSKRARRRRGRAPAPRTTAKPAQRSLTQRSVGAVKALAAVVGAVAAIVGGVVAVAGHFDNKSPPKANAEGRVSEIKLTPQPFGAWARSIGQDTSMLGEAAKKPGLLVNYRIRIVGYRGENLPLEWALVDEQGNPIRNGTRVLQPESDSDANTKQLWIPTDGVGDRSVRVSIDVFRPDHRNLIGAAKSSLWHP